MLQKATAAASAALWKGIEIVLVGALLIALIGWAKTHPEQVQTLLTNAMNTAVTLLTRFFNWLSTLGSN